MTAKRLFHLVPTPQWEVFVASAEAAWRPASLESEGFVHLSYAEQLAGTLEVHYAGVDAVALIEVDGERVEDALRVEVSRGGALFPHLYAALARAACLKTWSLVRGEDGKWELPADTLQ